MRNYLFVAACAAVAACSSDSLSTPDRADSSTASDTSVGQTTADTTGDATADDTTAGDTALDDTTAGDTHVDSDVPCSDACTTVDERTCVDGASYRVCQRAASGCLALVDVACTDDSACQGGVCEPVGTCVDQCAVAMTSCSGEDVVRCGELDLDACMDLQTISCGADAGCFAGACDAYPVAALACPEVIDNQVGAVLDASGSSDAEGIVSYTFSVGDLTYDPTSDAAPVLYGGDSGPMTASVVVTDTAGHTATASCQTAAWDQLGAVTSLLATPAEYAIELTWDSVLGAQSYEVRWSTSGDPLSDGETIVVAAEAGATQHYRHAELRIGTTYSYYVRAVNPLYAGAWSELAYALPTYADDLGIVVDVSTLKTCVGTFCSASAFEVTFHVRFINFGAEPIDGCYDIAVDTDVFDDDAPVTHTQCLQLAPFAFFEADIVEPGPDVDDGADARVSVLAHDANSANDAKQVHWTLPTACGCP